MSASCPRSILLPHRTRQGGSSPRHAGPVPYSMNTMHSVCEFFAMTRKQRHQRAEQALIVPPSPPPRNPFATTAKMRRGVSVHEPSQRSQRRSDNMRVRQWLRDGETDDL